MPFVLLFIGLMLTIVGVRNNQSAFFAQVSKDFTGQNNFTTWIIAIVVIGSLGYVKAIKTPVDLFLGLMLIGFLASNKAGLENLIPDIQNAFNSISTGSSSGNQQAAVGDTVSRVIAPPVPATGANSTEQSILDQVTGTDQQLIKSLTGG